MRESAKLSKKEAQKYYRSSGIGSESITIIEAINAGGQSIHSFSLFKPRRPTPTSLTIFAITFSYPH
jgi:hypothetical protein